MISKGNVLSAYNCLKSYAYYENLNFYLKAEIAKFENTGFDRKIKKWLIYSMAMINPFLINGYKASMLKFYQRRLKVI
ncbi:hypothetical protein EBJ56_03840 [Salmonella enterica]|nr:hypothetical protein [Salmonella enterica subsp. enterica serovar Kentucky]EEE2987343.1 hypothetical protein [Salmonella enterica subsp. enterica serovar 8,(20):i:-]EBM8457028.1 hypothetical protein [Salmonella enterica subsp. enterica serovar Kentucky]EBO9038989.1 hypothetical protein [Salmonella enterica subsp. enterica serovar Kentucky]EBO9178990.1 hypothetical protein [Salmonella enterica subsp. enterica serovar Kentucky]